MIYDGRSGNNTEDQGPVVQKLINANPRLKIYLAVCSLAPNIAQH